MKKNLHRQHVLLRVLKFWIISIDYQGTIPSIPSIIHLWLLTPNKWLVNNASWILKHYLHTTTRQIYCDTVSIVSIINYLDLFACVEAQLFTHNYPNSCLNIVPTDALYVVLSCLCHNGQTVVRGSLFCKPLNRTAWRSFVITNAIN